MADVQKKENPLKQMVENFDRFSEYLEPKMERDIEENRKGQFVVKFRDAEGNPLENVTVKVRQKKHEFKFGCSIFHLGQFPDEERNALYADRFRALFNYAIVPLYWDTLEPEEGKPRFGRDSVPISRRPPIDTIMEFCEENGIATKGHCLAYNSFQPDWLPDDNRSIKIKLDERMRAIAERYGNRIPDFDVINEMITIYKNCYPGNGMRNFQIADERDHEKFCFDLARRHFPHGRLFWNEGGNETFGSQNYRGYRSFYYMTIEKMLREGVPVGGIGMQYHMFSPRPDMANPLRIIDVFDCYGEFGLPIHVSEITLPSYSNDPEDEEIQAALTERLYRLWFGRKYCEAIVWWNFADNTAFKGENQYFGGLIRNDCSVKPAFEAVRRLVQEEWNTHFDKTVSGELRFSGFYGDYELEICHGETRVVKEMRFGRDNTGFDNRLCDFRAREIVL